MDVPVAANVLGTIGAICWSVQLLPQLWINWQRHNAVGLQPTMMMLWAWAGVPLGVYNIVESFNIALRIQPQILTLLSLTTWIQCFYYEGKWTVFRSLAVVVPVACIMGGIQTALIVALRIAKERHLQWPLTLMAVLSAVLLAAGVLRHYWDIYIHRTVRGISFVFVGIDAAGDLFSLVSLLFFPWVQQKLKRRGLVNDGTGLSPACSRTGGEEPIALRDLPSSTSVFRTPSGDLDVIRQRNVARGGGEEDGRSA
ncbi:hypothetical protein P280DRAFT_32644 [Massarina eburnea CBS 473.64]|uniref:PQ loop repeat protein n=1 Tax=Massarina eburnea CBS 473.64 TaxID=1395130 RepID=A0A6A6S239_9PLEO|nr:hypothetical protein P280DRAFT_32644 [Massarina eburnea CBS 473.64]